MVKALSEVIAAKESVEERILKQPGVTGIDVGYKYVGGHRTEEVAIRVMVEKKNVAVPAEEKVPDTIDGIKTDVIERTYFLQDAMKNKMKVDDISLQADTGNYSPVKGGISIGPCRVVGGFVFVGTLGAIVKDNATGNPLLLSNFHVMCIDNGWHVGDTMAQPGRVDGGSCPANVVGTLQRAALTGLVDCAVSSLSGRGFSCEIVALGKVAGTAVATLGMPVRKRGRTTGLTFGFVDSVSLSVNIDYGNGIGVRTLTNQIGIRPDTAHNPAFGDHGDSGSAVVDGTVHVVGLHFAGSNDGHGIANQIANVLTALNVSMCVAPVKPILKDSKDLHKDHEKFPIKEAKDNKDHKIEKLETKDHKVEVKDHHKEIEKNPIKEHKDIEKAPVKDHKDVEKPIAEHPGKGLVEGPPKLSDGPGIPHLPGQPGDGQAAKVADKLKDFKEISKEAGKDKHELKDVKDKEKNESKDFKDHKHEGKENKDGKDHKDQKEGKDHKEGKDNKDHKEHKEQKDHKEHKDHKPEFKEHKPEIKDHKHELKEIEKTFEHFDPKGGAESGAPMVPGQPSFPGSDLDQRMAQLEAVVAQLSTFITADLRPDLGAGALTNETDGSGAC